jgi:hypothetical protein
MGNKKTLRKMILGQTRISSLYLTLLSLKLDGSSEYGMKNKNDD